MALNYVIRMKNVARALLFLGSLVLWIVVLSVFNVKLGLKEEGLLVGAAALGLVQTVVLALFLKT